MDRRRFAIVSGLVVCAPALFLGCASTPPPAEPEASVTPEPTAVTPSWKAGAPLACSVSLTDEPRPHLVVNGEPTSQQLAEDLDIVVFPFDDRHVALALKTRYWSWFPRPESTTLYALDCEAPHDRTPLVTHEGSDFGQSALARDGAALYVSGHAVARLDFATLEVRELAKPATYTPSAGCHDEGTSARDIVTGWSEQGLVIERFHPCGFDGHWQGDEYVVEGLPATAKLQRTSPISTIAAGANGTLWAADGGRCEAPGTQDPQTRGMVWRSTDRGDTWEPIRFEEAEAEPGRFTLVTAARRVTVGEKPGQVIVATAVCHTDGVGVYGGLLYTSSDDGKTWKRIILPDDFSDSRVGDGVSDFELVKNKFNHVRAWPYKPHEREHIAWDTRDGGKNWVVNSNSPDGPPPPKREVELGDATFRATAMGVTRTDGSGTKVVLRPVDRKP